MNPIAESGVSSQPAILIAVAIAMAGACAGFAVQRLVRG